MPNKNKYKKLDNPNVANTVYLVEANSNEQQNIWETYVDKYKRITYEQINPGVMTIIGQLDNRDICLSLFWVKINGYLVCFYYATSQLVDHKMVEEFLEYNFPDIKKVDAGNFHNCVHYLENKAKGKTKQD